MGIVVIEDRHLTHAHFLQKHFERIGFKVAVCTSLSGLVFLMKEELVEDLVIDLDEEDPKHLIELRKVYTGPVIGWSSLPSTRSDSRVRAHCTSVYDIAQLMNTSAKDFDYSLTNTLKNDTVAD